MVVDVTLTQDSDIIVQCDFYNETACEKLKSKNVAFEKLEKI